MDVHPFYKLANFQVTYFLVSAKSYTCFEYLDKAVCPHLVACSNHYVVELRSYAPTQNLASKKRRGRIGKAKQALAILIN